MVVPIEMVLKRHRRPVTRIELYTSRNSARPRLESINGMRGNVANRITIGIGSGGYNSADQSLNSQEENEISFMLPNRNVLPDTCVGYIFSCIFQFLKLLC